MTRKYSQSNRLTLCSFVWQLDKADRYINNKTTKYLLRANRPDDAEATIGLFTRHEANPSQNLCEMQCSWFELEYGRAMQRKGDTGKALKKFGESCFYDI